MSRIHNTDYFTCSCLGPRYRYRAVIDLNLFDFLVRYSGHLYRSAFIFLAGCSVFSLFFVIIMFSLMKFTGRFWFHIFMVLPVFFVVFYIFCSFSELSECVKGILGELSVYQAVTSLYPSQAKTNHRSAVIHIAFAIYKLAITNQAL